MKFRNIIIPISLALSCGAPAAVSAAQDNDMQDQLNALKDEIVILQDQLEETNVSNANRMNISGYADIEYHNSSKNNEEPGFRLHHMSLFFEKRLTDQWKFFSEIEYEDAPFSEFEFTDSGTDSQCPGCYGKIYLEAANFTYAWEPGASFRGGRFFTPAGIWSVDHYPPFVPTQLRPAHIREIFPQVVDGITMFGTVPMGNMFMNYDIYAGNGEDNSGSKDLNSDKAVGAKISFLLPFFRYLEIGASVYSDTLNDDTQKDAAGAHLKMKLADFTLQSEYATATLENGGTSHDTEGYYVQLLYDINKWTYGVRHDYYNEDDTVDQDVTFNSVFINYHVNQAIVLKLEHHMVEQTSAQDYDHTVGSVVLYLGN
ncbi:MAG: hypothetical protein PVJ39_16540 [Gammaproteobacteria bacterium]|jgi:hypothetical protein